MRLEFSDHISAQAAPTPPTSHCICCCLRSPQHVRLSSPGDQEVKRLEDALTKREGIDGRARLSSAVTVFILCSAGACVSCAAKSPPGAFKPSPSPPPPPAFRQTLYFSPQCSLPRPHPRLPHPSVSLFSLQSSSLPSLAALEVLLKTQQQRGREEEETRSGGKVIPSLPLRRKQQGWGVGRGKRSR